MRNTFILIAFSLFISLTSAFAQVGELEDVLLLQVGRDAKKQLIKNLSQKEIAALKSMQVEGNYNSIVQNGSLNTALIQQIGSGNVVDLEQQGNNNVFDAEIEGNDNLNAIQQYGDDNTIVQRLNTNGHIYKISQIGSGLTLNQTEVYTIQPIPIEIKQRGHDMQVTITNGSVGLVPISVK